MEIPKKMIRTLKRMIKYFKKMSKESRLILSIEIDDQLTIGDLECLYENNINCVINGNYNLVELSIKGDE